MVALAPAAHAQTSVSFSKSFGPAAIGPGSVSTLSFSITNNTASPVLGLGFTDPLPAGVTIATPANATTTCGGSVSAPAGGGTIGFSGASLGGSSSCTITVAVIGSTPGAHTNVTGDLTSTAGNHGSATATLTVAADRPGFSKSFSPATVAFNGRSTLTFLIDNTANDATAFNLTFTDSLPSGMVVASPSNASTTCSGGVITAPVGGSTVSYGPGFPGTASVAAGASCIVRVDVIGGSVGTLINTSGELTSIETGPIRSSGKATAALVVTNDQLSLSKTFTDDPVPPGGTVTLRFTILNLSRDTTAEAIAFTDDLDAVLSGLEAVPPLPTDPCGAGSSLTGTGLLSLTGGVLPPGGSCTFSVTLQVPAGAATGEFTNTTSQITADLGGRPVTAAAATDVLFVSPVPLLTKEFTDDPVGAGGSVTLEFTITNTSATSPATDIGFSDELPDVVEAASSVPSPGFCGAGSTATFTPPTAFEPAMLVVSGGSLPAGGTCAFSLVLEIGVDAAGGTYPNVTSAITATIDGASVTGGPASDDLVVVAAPALLKEFIGDPVSPGDTVILRFTLTLDEESPGSATGIGFSDDLDAALSGLTAVAPLPTDPCGAGSTLGGTMTLLLSGGTLAPGESCSFDVTLQVPGTAPAGPHTNTTSAVVAEVLGAAAMSPPASDDLNIAGLTLTKEFIDDPVLPGGTVTLRFTIVNDSPVSSATDIFFIDDVDDTLSGLANAGGTQTDVCGTGSQIAGSGVLTFSGGSLAPGASCTFDVSLTVPAGAASDSYSNVTTAFSANIDGSIVFFDNATDQLVVADDFLTISKQFLDDPVSPGDPVTLRFNLVNLSETQAITGIAFTDDLDAALSGLASTSGTLLDVCGTGSQISGTGLLTFTGGSLGLGGVCSFDVTLAVPAATPLGTVATNVTSEVTGTVGGLPVTGAPATDDLEIDFLVFTKEFIDDPVSSGDTVTLVFSIENLSETEAVGDLSFSDDLSAVLPGLEAIGLPVFDVCGAGSQLAGTSFLTFTGGSLLPSGSCSFAVLLTVPEDATDGSYPNVTSDLVQVGIPVSGPATDTLLVIEDVDGDDDGVLDGDDVCPGTVIPEGVPTQGLQPNRYALVDDDFIFDTVVPPGGGPGDVFTTTDTAGCSCEQIIDVLGLGQGHRKHGCSLGAMRTWVQIVSGNMSWRGYRAVPVRN